MPEALPETTSMPAMSCFLSLLRRYPPAWASGFGITGSCTMLL
jgi:hypothetical protein